MHAQQNHVESWNSTHQKRMSRAAATTRCITEARCDLCLVAPRAKWVEDQALHFDGEILDLLLSPDLRNRHMGESGWMGSCPVLFVGTKTQDDGPAAHRTTLRVRRPSSSQGLDFKGQHGLSFYLYTRQGGALSRA